MSTVTAIELGADTCVLVKAGVRGTQVRVGAVETLDPAAFPGIDTFAGALRQVRKTRRLPRRARVVLWGLPDGATSKDAAVTPVLAPLVEAGFKIDRVVTACNALAALSRLRPPRQPGAVAWLATNKGNVAIAVVRPGEQLYAREFPWDSSIGATGSHARLLQRYSLVAFLAPELRRGIEAAREKGSRVEAVVTCGNLPDLRSLTMPLIEELDLEVETLDSLDGLLVKPASTEALAEAASSIRIACAGAVARATRGTAARSGLSRTKLLRAAALIIAAAGIAWLGYTIRTVPSPAPRLAVRGTESKSAGTVQKAQPPATSVAQAPLPVTPMTKPAPPLGAPAPRPTAPAPVKTAPASTTPPATQPQAASPPSTPRQEPASIAARSQEPAPALATTAPLRSAPARTDKLDARPAQREPLADPLPRFTTILVSQERRFAMLDGGRVVSVGDTIGQRVVTSIEPRAVVLKEPSGVQIRVGLGGRLAGVDKGR